MTAPVRARELEDMKATWHQEAVQARQDCAAAEREADRLRHGVPVEGDFVCPDSLDKTKAVFLESSEDK